MGIEKGTTFLYRVKWPNKTQRKKVSLCLILPQVFSHRDFKVVLPSMNFFAERWKKASMLSSKLNWQDFSAARSTVPPGGIHAIAAMVSISAPSWPHMAKSRCMKIFILFTDYTAVTLIHYIFDSLYIYRCVFSCYCNRYPQICPPYKICKYLQCIF